MITLGYWRTRAGEKRRVICTDKPGNYPVVALTESGEITTHTPGGRHYYREASACHPSDLIAPWVDTPVVRECWVGLDERGVRVRVADTKQEAEKFRAACLGAVTIHHLREVNFAREDAVEKLVALAREAVFDGCAYLAMKQALAELDKAGGL